MSNRLSDRFKQGDESTMQMMARIQSEITTDAIADQWQSKLEEFGVVFSHDEFPEGRTLPLRKSSMFSMEVRKEKSLNPKSKSIVIRERTVFILIPSCHS